MQGNKKKHQRYGKLLLAVEENKTIGEKLLRSIPYSFGALVAVIVNSVFINQGVFVLTIAAIAIIFGSPLIAALLPSKHRFYLYEAGVFIKSGLRSNLYHWDSFKHFTADGDKKSLQLKISIGSIQLRSREHFDEVRQIISEYVPGKDESRAR